MKTLFFFLFVCVGGAYAQDCQQILKNARNEAKKGNYQLAIAKYTTAINCDKNLQETVNKELSELFRKIENDRIRAEKAEKKALEALNRLLVILKANISNALSRYHIVEVRGELDKIRTLGISNAATLQKLEKQINDSLQALMPDMVLVKGGKFMMGYDSLRDGKDENMDNAKPLHEVELDDFWIGKTEVRQALWKKVMGNNPSSFKPPNYPDCPNCPVESMSYVDIQDFFVRLEEKTGEKMTLPSEAQWEYAARGGNKSGGFMYAGSNNIDEVAWYHDNSDNKTHEVGTKKPNELGIYDMSGNVWEWCLDGYDKDFYAELKALPHGEGLGGAINLINNRAKDLFVLRGGSYFNADDLSRLAYRIYNYPTFRYSFMGFRVCRRVQF